MPTKFHSRNSGFILLREETPAFKLGMKVSSAGNTAIALPLHPSILLGTNTERSLMYSENFALSEGYRHKSIKKLWPSGRGGFMLLEVMLSVLVISVGVVFVISSFITSIKAFKLSRVYVEAAYLLEQKLWDYEEKGKIEEGRDSGRFDDYKGAEWEVDAEELDDLPLNETTAQLILKTDTGERNFAVTTYFYKEE